ncbi:PucR family transcriptional regulator [Speluncibacter jeojiensis]|uniref:Helix-turn-helix domain-containing protein n=1 Tax=Speluncibacter jeojiensis TaxID=2710754 RepID=A0A9X4RFH0_9ACTN|nr:helix-turn-helix domain-containing protein [Rhodococcus sp. D2-41]MDG3016267.1 helix-turn-helix domain-containing protein [Corynebacteriales bacterium D3-21]
MQELSPASRERTVIESPDTGIAALQVAGEPMSTPLRNLRPLAADLVAHFSKTISPFGGLPEEQVLRDLTEVTVQCLQLGIQMLDEQRLPTDEDLADVRASAARRARAGVPLEEVLAVYHEGIRTVRDLVMEKAAPEDIADLQTGGRLLFSLVERLNIAASSSYLEEFRALTSDVHTATHTLVNALLSGANPTSVARQLGLELQTDHLVVGLWVAPHPDEVAAGRDKAAAARKKLGIIQSELAAQFGSPLLGLLSPQGGTLLIPGAPDWDQVREAVRLVSMSAEVDITASAVQVHTADIPAAAEQVHELLSLARQLGRPPGLYGLVDLALEFQVTRPGPGRAHLAQLLRPLDGSPELLQTLKVHVDNDLNRQRTANRLHLHTNTVDYRMKRIAQLTGLDPTRPSGLCTLKAAMVARDFLDAKGPARD